MNIEYLINEGFIFNSIKIEWNNDRNSVREKFKNKHKEADKIIEIAHFFEGNENMNIHQKRDIYENLNSKNDILFLNYDKDDKLRELEVHSGFDILINNIQLVFGNEISDFLNQFQKIGIEYSETEKDSYLLPKLKMTIADSESMGGNGTGLSYFYASYEISHLTE